MQLNDKVWQLIDAKSETVKVLKLVVVVVGGEGGENPTVATYTQRVSAPL